MNNKKADQQLVRRKYSPQFKDQALERIAKDGVRQVAKDLGLGARSIFCSLYFRELGNGVFIIPIPLYCNECGRYGNQPFLWTSYIILLSAGNTMHHIIKGNFFFMYCAFFKFLETFII